MTAGRQRPVGAGPPVSSDLLRRARAALTTDDAGLLDELAPELERLRVSIAAMSPEAAATEWRNLLSLLDDAEGLTAALRAARARVLAGLREAGARHRAGAAYRRAGRLGDRDDP